MKRDHLTKERRPRHLDVGDFPEGVRVKVLKFRQWSRENFQRDPTEAEVRRYLRGLE